LVYLYSTVSLIDQSLYTAMIVHFLITKFPPFKETRRSITMLTSQYQHFPLLYIK